MGLEGKILKARWTKLYATAHNHVAVGIVLEETPQYLVMMCKTYHYSKMLGGKNGVLASGEYVGGIREGEKGVRIIPWDKIEVINQLPDDTEWDVPAYVEESGICYLDNKYKTLIAHSSMSDV